MVHGRILGIAACFQWLCTNIRNLRYLFLNIYVRCEIILRRSSAECDRRGVDPCHVVNIDVLNECRGSDASLFYAYLEGVILTEQSAYWGIPILMDMGLLVCLYSLRRLAKMRYDNDRVASYLFMGGYAFFSVLSLTILFGLTTPNDWYAWPGVLLSFIFMLNPYILSSASYKPRCRQKITCAIVLAALVIIRLSVGYVLSQHVDIFPIQFGEFIQCL